MERVPRYTDALKKYAGEILEEWLAIESAAIKEAFLEASLDLSPKNIAKLAGLIREESPRLHALYGPFLEDWLGAFIRRKQGDLTALDTPLRLLRLTPDNPILRLPGGGYFSPLGFFATEDWVKHGMQVRNYERALGELGKRGRPPSPPTATPRPSSGRGINEGVARQAADLFDDGQSKWNIAIALGLVQRPPKNRKCRKRILQRVSRIIERGHILQKKTIQHPKK